MSQVQSPSSDEQEDEIAVDTPIATPEVEVTAPEQLKSEEQEQEEEFDPKQRVDFSTPEQQKKFNDVYKQMKMSDSRNQMLKDMLDKAMGRLSEVESRFSQTDQAEAERILTSRLKEARETGDEDKADKIMQEIIDFRVDSKLKGKEEKPKQQDYSPQELADARTVANFANETDVRGNPLRPWIADNHPQHANAMKLAQATAISVNAEFGYVDIPEVMKRMDDAMKGKPKLQTGNSRAADPMRGNLTNQSPRGKMKLSPQEAAVAQKLGVKPEDYLKWKS